MKYICDFNYAHFLLNGYLFIECIHTPKISFSSDIGNTNVIEDNWYSLKKKYKTILYINTNYIIDNIIITTVKQWIRVNFIYFIVFKILNGANNLAAFESLQLSSGGKDVVGATALRSQFAADVVGIGRVSYINL